MSALDDALAKQVLFDLFSRLPTATLVYSCRLACEEWRRIIDIDMRALWDRRARTLCDAASTADVGATQMLPRTVESAKNRCTLGRQDIIEMPLPMQSCVLLIKQAYKRWHVERVLRSWRKEFRARSVAHRKFWREKKAEPLALGEDARVLTLAAEMNDALDTVCVELDDRILDDDNDMHADALLLSLANQSCLAAANEDF